MSFWLAQEYNRKWNQPFGRVRNSKPSILYSFAANMNVIGNIVSSSTVTTTVAIVKLIWHVIHQGTASILDERAS